MQNEETPNNVALNACIFTHTFKQSWKSQRCAPGTVSPVLSTLGEGPRPTSKSKPRLTRPKWVKDGQRLSLKKNMIMLLQIPMHHSTLLAWMAWFQYVSAFSPYEARAAVWVAALSISERSGKLGSTGELPCCAKRSGMKPEGSTALEASMIHLTIVSN